MDYSVKKITFLVLLVVACTTSPASSYADSIEEALSVCDTTALFREKSYPKDTNLNARNNLRRDAGSGFEASGRPIVIKGKILDKFCLPVSNAQIEIWHPDADGAFPWEYDDYADFFLGYGVAYSNNLGEFSFLTIRPGSKNKRLPPYVSFRVTDSNLGKLSTRMYFPEETANRNDSGLKKAVNRGYHPFAIKKTLEGQGEDEYLFNIRYPKSERWSVEPDDK